MSSLLCYKRVLLKISGESLADNSGFGIDPEAITGLIDQIAKLVDQGVEVGLVIGAGNFLRGDKLNSHLLHNTTIDQMGMLGTVINGIALRDILITKGVQAETLAAQPTSGIVDVINPHYARQLLAKGLVVVFAGGTGNPYVTTDSAASLRASEVDADLLIKATTVDGLYDRDPHKHPNAKPYRIITFDEVIQRQLKVMDFEAFVQCRNQNIPICIFNLQKPAMIGEIVSGKRVGTIIAKESHDDR